ncbi:5-oxoprolinase-like isoform X2 [Limulus polyphemus]|uniref:5-oxoprolinase-like isoform X2 n=1 Tax=Limulus polyphemus TaxID=6850 RepID=A0ABM1SI67_LIMPO|nr:5-oxoprolinase-like isoform X2 [Limulus polyphemus]
MEEKECEKLPLLTGFQFAIDRGGTFTDIFGRCPDGKIRLMKLLSEDPINYSDAPSEGIRRIIKETGISICPSDPIDTSKIEWIRMGTTVATNALLERKGERMALAITAGFKDLLFIGNQARPNIFDLKIKCPEMLYEDVIEVEERVLIHQQQCQLNKKNPICVGTTNEKLEIWTPVNLEKLRIDLENTLSKGISSLAIVLAHSYIFPDHEIQVGNLAKMLGFRHVSLSSNIMPMVRMVPRGFTACTDAYLTPCIKKYVNGFSSGFKNNLKDVNCLFMQSDGGLTPMNQFCGSKAILSGPAGGVVGYALTTYKRETNLPVIGFDMGGTSTDVSRYDGHFEHIFETSISGISIQAPQLDIKTVAAGGGSMLFFRSGLFVVGPDSAGSHPGPVCYRKGGPLTVTDANLCLGRLLPDYFPKIFGDKEDQPLDKEETTKAFQELTNKVNTYLLNQSEHVCKEPMTREEVALGFIRVANETMCRPIRALTQVKGYDTSQHVLASFGGAGGQHACAIARSLGISSVFIHRYAGILSAFGMALADVVHEVQEPCAVVYCIDSLKTIDERITAIRIKCIDELKKLGFDESRIQTEPHLHMRYEKTDYGLMCSASGYKAGNGTSCYGDFLSSFYSRHQQEFGFNIDGRSIIIDDIRVRGTGKSGVVMSTVLRKATAPPPVEFHTKCYFEGGYQDTKVFLLCNLLNGHVITGPSIIIDDNCTILVEPDCEATVTAQGDIEIKVYKNKTQNIGTELDTIQLSIFSHRFMSIAEQMGRVLQRTSISTNIKERLDFSCALFGPDGGLVSNAPHIPVHLGAMQEAVQFQMRNLGDNIQPGDVLLSNHPCAGGSHLPDLTVITPVFYKGFEKPMFFVASRGHHADIGGVTPGSMPPHSKTLQEEGATFISFKLVKNGIFQEEDLIEQLMAPAKYPGCSGSRNLKDNISDLKAQVAANHKGITLVSNMIDTYGIKVIQAYMGYIQANAELAVRDMLKQIGRNFSNEKDHVELSSEDYMDDGTLIKLHLTIHTKKGTAVFDFSGTSHEVYGNCNTPTAVTLSAIIYCLRCLVGHDVPLNQGCLAPVKIVIPEGSILSPYKDAAVVGGNVLTSQRIVDVVLKAFGACAASQGCMNNITFGDEEVGYYETVAGGAGAGPSWHGRSGVHSHMTNTRITDPEILEKRYPVVVQKFQLNPDSGGSGQYHGGDGVVRELLFRKDLTLSVLTERRVFTPYGLFGGKNGKQGLNLLIYNNGRIVNLGGKTCVKVSAGDVFHMETPGGGGYGSAD